MTEKKLPMHDLLKKLPPNYSLGTIYLNGIPVQVTHFSNLDENSHLAYFIADGQVTVLDSQKIDGISFAPAADVVEEVIEEEEEEW
ncbi:hypothetical protein IM538_07715 [Cytobacillus suaedae]|nr:hypothetical protein IM538_07715 [Cytobacillus suaedae]